MEKSFIFLIFEDVNISFERVSKFDTPTHRREFVKSAYSAIEGLNWQNHQNLFTSSFSDDLEPHEVQLLREENYIVDDRGLIKVQQKNLPLLSSFKLPIKLMEKYIEGYKCLAFEGRGWNSFRDGLKVRNRLMHPKSIEDLQVSDPEMTIVLDGFRWAGDLAIHALETINLDLKKKRDGLVILFEK